MSQSDDREIAGMETAEAERVDQDHVRAEEHLATVEAFIREHGVEALETAPSAGALFRRVRLEFRWALGTAVSAALTRGVDGYLVIKVPQMPSDLTEMSYLTGGVQLQLGFSQPAP